MYNDTREEKKTSGDWVWRRLSQLNTTNLNKSNINPIVKQNEEKKQEVNRKKKIIIHIRSQSEN